MKFCTLMYWITLQWIDKEIFFAAYAFYILYNIAPYIKVHKSDNKISKEQNVY